MRNIKNKEKTMEKLEDEATLDKIRYFKGTFQDLKSLMDKKANHNTNAMDDIEYKYPNKRKATGTSPVYQTFGIVNNPNKKNKMKNLHTFESFNEEYYVMGFGAPGGMGQPGSGTSSGYGLGWPDYRSYTGYTMTPVMGIINELSDTLSNEAESYDLNENPQHTKESYLKEAHSYIISGLRNCYVKNGIEDSNWVNEEDIFEFDAVKKTKIITDRNIRNQKGLEASKVKGDKEGQKLYQLKLKIDQLDLQKTKLKDEVSKIQGVRRNNREKIKQISRL